MLPCSLCFAFVFMQSFCTVSQSPLTPAFFFPSVANNLSHQLHVLLPLSLFMPLHSINVPQLPSVFIMLVIPDGDLCIQFAMMCVRDALARIPHVFLTLKVFQAGPTGRWPQEDPELVERITCPVWMCWNPERLSVPVKIGYTRFVFCLVSSEWPD